MPKLSGIKIAHRRALNRIQVPGVLPAPELRLSAAQWVKTLRVAYHMTQRQLAERSRVTQSQIALIEKGFCEPQLSTLRKIFDALYCDLIVLPAPRRRLAAVVAEMCMGVPHRSMWDYERNLKLLRRRSKQSTF